MVYTIVMPRSSNPERDQLIHTLIEKEGKSYRTVARMVGMRSAASVQEAYEREIERRKKLSTVDEN